MKPAIKTCNISDLILNPKNPRQNDIAAEKLIPGIEKYGFINPVIVNKNNVVLAGHTRIKALKTMGKDKVSAIYVDMSEADAKAFAIWDNKSAEFSHWDDDLLKVDLEFLEDDALTGFSSDEIDKLFAEDKAEEKTELEITAELFEAHNYIILYFDNELDWEVAQEKLSIGTKKTSDSREGYMRAGTGRVLKGSDVLRRIND